MTSAASMRAALHEDVALEWHLQYNHYPPLDPRTVIIAKKVLAHIRSCEDLDNEKPCSHTYELPAAIGTFGNGESSAPYSVLMDAWHLWDFIQPTGSGIL